MMKNIKIRNIDKEKNDSFYVIDNRVLYGTTYYLAESENFGELKTYLCKWYDKENNTIYAIRQTEDDIQTTLDDIFGIF